MRFASCILLKKRILIYEFEKDYNTVHEKGLSSIEYGESLSYLQHLDFMDIIMPARDVLFYTKEYPPVKGPQLEKIIAQDIGSVTPFNPEELIFDFEKFSDTKTTVFMVFKERIRELMGRLDSSLYDKIRAIIPEELLFFKNRGVDNGLVIGEDYSVLVTREGQIVRNIGFETLRQEISDLYGDAESSEDYEKWLDSIKDLSIFDTLSEEEIRIRKKIEGFYKSIYERFSSYIGSEQRLGFYLSDAVIGSGEKLLNNIAPESEEFTVDEVLRRLYEEAEDQKSINFAKGEFAYKGGFGFHRKKLIATIVMLLVGFLLFFMGMQFRLSDLDSRVERIEERTRKAQKRVLGREYPSTKQALSIMMRTIEGKGSKDKRKLYPYSSLFIIETVFPQIAFEGSTVEVQTFSVKDGKIKVTGFADSDTDIFKMIENLEQLPFVSDLNKGAINTYRGRNKFSISFSFEKKEKEEKRDRKKENKKKGKGAN